MDRNNDNFNELYEIWSKEEWSEKDPLRIVNLARKLTEIDPENIKGWCALVDTIEWLICPANKYKYSNEEKEKMKKDPFFWELVNAVNKQLELNPEEASSLWNLALCFDTIELYDKAYEAYIRVAEISLRNPSELWSSPHIDYNKAGIAIYKHGDYKKAVEALELSIEYEDDEITYADTWYYLGKSREKLGEHKDALEALEEATRLSPDKYKEEFLILQEKLEGSR